MERNVDYLDPAGLGIEDLAAGGMQRRLHRTRGIWANGDDLEFVGCVLNSRNDLRSGSKLTGP